MFDHQIMTGLIPGVSEICELFDDQFKAWFQCMLDKQPIHLGERVAEILRKHAHKLNSKDPEGSVQEYVFELMTDLQSLAGAQVMKYRAQKKSIVNLRGNGLKPNDVKELLFRDKTMWKEGEHSSSSHFLSRAGDIATQLQRLEDIRPCKTK